MSSLKKLKKNLPQGSDILSVTRKESSLPLTKTKFTQLKQLTRRFVEAENYFLKHFAGIEGLKYLTYPKGLRDHYVQNGLPEELAHLKLQARQWKMALDTAFDTIKSSHALTREEVKRSLNRSTLWNDKEKHVIRYLLLRSDLLYWICQGKFKEVISSTVDGGSTPSAKDLKKVLSWLRRRYRECHSKHKRCQIRSLRTYHVDSNMFSFFKEKETCYIAVASLIPRQRIVIPLTNSSLQASDLNGNIKVVIKREGQVEIHRTINTLVPQCKVSKEEAQKAALSSVSPTNKAPIKITAIDKGFKTLIHTDQETSYGQGFSDQFMKWSDELTEVNAGRARFHSHVRNLKTHLAQTKNPQTRRKIQKKMTRIEINNLGNLKVTLKRQRIRSGIQKEVGTAVNALYRIEKPDVLVTENLNFISFKNLGKRTNRLLNTWSKGILREALETGAKKNGVLLEGVNAAFTSQYCRRCYFVDRNNRCGAVFACKKCFYKENADFAAAKNVRDRFFDSEIGVYTPVKEVKKVLEERHRVRLSTLGLNKSVNRLSSANDQRMLSRCDQHI